MLTKCLGSENLELLFRVAPKSICGPLSQATNANNALVSPMFLQCDYTGWLKHDLVKAST